MSMNDYGVGPIFATYPDLDPDDATAWLLEIGHPGQFLIGYWLEI